jgi:hypothetical protein
MEAVFATAGRASAEDLDTCSRVSANLRRLLESVGLQRHQRDVTTLSWYCARASSDRARARIRNEALEHDALERWQREPVGFINEVLRNPKNGQPFHLFEAQKQFFKHAWRAGDGGRLLYPERFGSRPPPAPPRPRPFALLSLFQCTGV